MFGFLIQEAKLENSEYEVKCVSVRIFEWHCKNCCAFSYLKLTISQKGLNTLESQSPMMTESGTDTVDERFLLNFRILIFQISRHLNISAIGQIYPMVSTFSDLNSEKKENSEPMFTTVLLKIIWCRKVMLF